MCITSTIILFYRDFFNLSLFKTKGRKVDKSIFIHPFSS